MKKLIALMMTVLLVLAMAACGDSAPAQPYIPPVDNGTNPPAAGGESTAPTGSVAVPVLPGQQEQAPTTEATEPRTETVPQATVGTPVTPGQQETSAYTYIEPGRDDGYHYFNYSIGLDFYAPDGLVYETQEQLMTRNGMPAGSDWDAVNDKASSAAVYVMYASQESTASTAHVMVQRLTYEQVEQMSMKDALLSQKDTLVAAYENMGFTNVEIKYGKTKLTTREVDALTLTAYFEGRPFYAATLLYGIGDLVVTVSGGSLDVDIAKGMLSGIEIE